MSEPVIICPHCKNEVKLTESLAAPLVDSVRKEYERKLVEKDTFLAKRESLVEEAKAELAQGHKDLNAKVAEKLKVERVRIEEEATKQATATMAADMDRWSRQVTELKGVLSEKDKKLAAAQEAEIKLARKERELDDAKREMELNIERQVNLGLNAVREKTRAEVEEQLKLKVMEKDETIASLGRTVEDLKRKVEQGSQQLQGEVQEMQLEATLKELFPSDDITPVAKGEHGGDIVQKVMTSAGELAGTIIWESKRTKAWNHTWLPKLRDDQRAAKADLAILVSTVLPTGVEQFSADWIDGIWVIALRVVKPMAIAMRQQLLEVSGARRSAEGQGTKMELVYSYLTGPRFRQRVQAIVEAFSSMHEDLDKERKAITKQWAKREEQIERVMQSTVGMYGDLQGIAGKSVQEIEGLDLAALPAPKEAA